MPQIFQELDRLVLYRGLLNDPLIALCRKMPAASLTENDKAAVYSAACYHLFACHDQMPLLNNHWSNYILRLVAGDENPFSLACEIQEPDALSPALLAAASHDLDLLVKLYHFDWTALGQSFGLPAESWFDFSTNAPAPAVNHTYASALQSLALKMDGNCDLTAELGLFYHQHACGELAIYRAFNWDGRLKGIKYPDMIRLDDLIGYESQKQALRKNTEAFLSGRGGNNVLLFGDKGTGKSSSVKALLNEYRSLRMIELQRRQLEELDAIIAFLRRRSGFYIIFIDDLSFEDFEVQYKYLKSHIEGSLQAPAENVRFYVTSNRRHLIRENWSDRQQQDDVHGRETQQEKLSFADRFGLTLTYSSPGKEEYLKIVQEIARQEGLNVKTDLLHHLALQWELRYHGRSGRSARQFINDLKGRL